MIEHFTETRVRYAETDQMQIAHHSNYIVWFELARVELMKSLGWDYASMEKAGYWMPVLEVRVHYLKPLFFDDWVRIRAFIEERPSAKIKYQYEIFNARQERICQGYTVHGFMNAKNRAIKPPRAFIKKMQSYF